MLATARMNIGIFSNAESGSNGRISDVFRRQLMSHEQAVLGGDGARNPLGDVSYSWEDRLVVLTALMAREASIQFVRFPAAQVFKLWQQGRTATRARASTALSITRSVRAPQA